MSIQSQIDNENNKTVKRFLILIFLIIIGSGYYFSYNKVKKDYDVMQNKIHKIDSIEKNIENIYLKYNK